MAHDLFSSLDSFTTFNTDTSALLVRDVAGSYRPAGDDEILNAAQCLLASRVRGTDTLNSPQMVKDFLKLRLAGLEHEVFAVLHLDSQHRVVEYVEMFRGTVSQTSIYPRGGQGRVEAQQFGGHLRAQPSIGQCGAVAGGRDADSNAEIGAVAGGCPGH
jgi:DNA repair protein RadC